MMLITMPLLGVTEQELLTGVAVIGAAAAAVGLIIWAGARVTAEARCPASAVPRTGSVGQ